MNDHLWENLHLSGPATMEPGVIQDFDFENWTEADRGWKAFIQPIGGNAMIQLIFHDHADKFISPVGISWEQAKQFLYRSSNNAAVRALLDQAPPGQPFETTQPSGDPEVVQAFHYVIEKVQD